GSDCARWTWPVRTSPSESAARARAQAARSRERARNGVGTGSNQEPIVARPLEEGPAPFRGPEAASFLPAGRRKSLTSRSVGAKKRLLKRFSTPGGHRMRNRRLCSAGFLLLLACALAASPVLAQGKS